MAPEPHARRLAPAVGTAARWRRQRTPASRGTTGFRYRQSDPRRKADRHGGNSVQTHVPAPLLLCRPPGGAAFSSADVYLEKTAAGWRVYAKSARTIAVDDRVEADAEITKIAEPYDHETQAWLNHVIGESKEELTARQARFRDTAILDLIQKVQLEAGKADVSMVASFNSDARISKGPVTVRDIAGLYVYENTLAVLEVTGRQLKDALEHSATYFRDYEPGKTPPELINDKIPAYNFDIAEGVTYELDISKPIGQRIQNLKFRGQPVTPDQKFRLATNNYRVNGGGGYLMYKDAPVVYRSSEEIRELIIDWAERNKQIPVEPNNNWRIVP